jgi:hypothetical protein
LKFGAGPPEQLRTLINHETRAAAINDFEAIRMPGLLQTEDYAPALIERVIAVEPGGVDSRVRARIGRQSLFSRDRPPLCTFYLHELVFHLPIGGREVMSNQMHHLLGWASGPPSPSE